MTGEMGSLEAKGFWKELEIHSVLASMKARLCRILKHFWEMSLLPILT